MISTVPALVIHVLGNNLLFNNDRASFKINIDSFESVKDE